MSSGCNSRVDDLESAGQKCDTRILCLGNELLGDDSLGSVVAAQLQQFVAAEVRIVSCPESGLSLLDFILNVDQLIVVDTVQTGSAPVGTIYQLREEDLQVNPGGSAHYIGLLDALALGRHLRLSVPGRVLILAVEMTADCTIGQPMHPAVVASIPALLEVVRQVLANSARRRVFPPIADRNLSELPEQLSTAPKWIRGGIMSVLLVLLMFAVVMLVGYFLERRQPRYMPAATSQENRAGSPRFAGKLGIEIPDGYLFHPCHTWAFDEGWQTIRVGLDNFAATLFGRVDHITVTTPNRWVRQGQKLMTITFDGVSVDLPSPVEGTVISVNGPALEGPDVVTNDPLHEGWLAVIKAASFDSDRKNLIPPGMSESWMRTSMFMLQQMCSQEPALAQDGGRPISGVLKRISRELRNKIIKEFFLASAVEIAQDTVQHPL